MGHDPWLESLRRAAGSPDALERVLAEDLPTDALQQIGDALLAVSDLAGTDLSGVVDRLVEQLRARRWDGDDELADALDRVAGRSPSPLQLLPVELDDVGEALSQQAGSANYLDLQSGTVWFQTMTDFGVDDDLDVNFEDETRWLFLEGEGSHDAYRDLGRFIGSVEDHDLAARLTRAIQGRGAFKRFRGVLERDPGEYTRWHRFDADVRLGHARSWIAGHGYEARPARRTDLP
ncbi:MAG TPA: UPF0158 family protein [Acidimicrobiia bacterium]|jgi:hypothetical protein